MAQIKAAIVGYGNIGHFVLDALQAAPDFEIAGVVRRSVANIPAELASYKVVTDIDELGKVDVAILCTPTREVEKYAAEYLAKGINTVDSFDIHTDICKLRASLDSVAKANRSRDLRRLGSGERLRSARPASGRCPQRHHLHQLRPRHEHGTHRMRQIEARGKERPVDDHPSRHRNPPPHGLRGT